MDLKEKFYMQYNIKEALEMYNELVITGPMNSSKAVFLMKLLFEQGKESQIIILSPNRSIDMPEDNLDTILNSDAETIILESMREYEQSFLEELSSIPNKQFIFSIESLKAPHHILSSTYEAHNDTLWNWIEEKHIPVLELQPH